MLSQHAMQVVSQHALQQGGVLSQHAMQVVSQHLPCSRGVSLLWGVPAPEGVPASRGCLVLGGGAWSRGAWSQGYVAFCYALLLCPSVMVFWLGGLLIEGGLLAWSSRGQKVITEGHHARRYHTRRPPHQKAPHQKAPHQKATTPEGHNRRGCLVETPPPMATAVGSTHPTGMHSCEQFYYL